jgi:hypothetical protein
MGMVKGFSYTKNWIIILKARVHPRIPAFPRVGIFLHHHVEASCLGHLQIGMHRHDYCIDYMKYDEPDYF